MLVEIAQDIDTLATLAIVFAAWIGLGLFNSLM